MIEIELGKKLKVPDDASEVSNQDFGGGGWAGGGRKTGFADEAGPEIPSGKIIPSVTLWSYVQTDKAIHILWHNSSKDPAMIKL